MLRLIYVILVLIFAASGCVSPLGFGASGPARADSQNESINDELVNFVATGPENGNLKIMNSSLGPGNVTIGRQYLSGLGQTCRKALFTNTAGQRRAMAVCREADQRWALAPDVFGPEPSYARGR